MVVGQDMSSCIDDRPGPRSLGRKRLEEEVHLNGGARHVDDPVRHLFINSDVILLILGDGVGVRTPKPDEQNKDNN